MNATTPSLYYDAIAVLGFGPPSNEPLPDTTNGEIIIRYGGWSLQELRDSEFGGHLMHKQEWYEAYRWSKRNLPAGTYSLRIPVKNSNNKNLDEQRQLLSKDEHVASIVLVASAVLSHHLQQHEDLLKGDWTRCDEQDVDGDRVGLYWNRRRLYVSSGWGVLRCGCLWLSSVRTF
jgi:hypothetical protein